MSILWILFLALPSVSFSQIQTEGLQSYWVIADILKTDKKPSESAWHTFFQNPQNQYCLKQNRDTTKLKQRFISNMELAYMPSQNISQKNSTDAMLQDIIYLRDNEERIKGYINSLNQNTLIDTMYQLAYRYLDKSMQRKIPDLRIYYIGPLLADAVAKNNSMYINVVPDYKISSIQMGLIGAHELHHLLVPKFRPSKMDPNAIKHFILVLTINSLLLEGTADLVDKKLILFGEENFFNSLLKKSLHRSDSLIKNLNAQIERIDESNISQQPKLGAGNIGGHEPGFFMALVIERNGYLPELLKNINNPFKFIYIYNKAAEKDSLKAPMFSLNAINNIKNIEQLYN